MVRYSLQNGAVKSIGFNANSRRSCWSLSSNPPGEKPSNPPVQNFANSWKRIVWIVFVWLILTYIFWGKTPANICEQAHLGLIRSHREQFLWYTDTLYATYSSYVVNIFSPLAIHQSSRSSHHWYLSHMYDIVIMTNTHPMKIWIFFT